MSPDTIVRFIVGCFSIWVVCVSLLIWLNVRQSKETERSYDVDFKPEDAACFVGTKSRDPLAVRAKALRRRAGGEKDEEYGLEEIELKAVA